MKTVDLPYRTKPAGEKPKCCSRCEHVEIGLSIVAGRRLAVWLCPNVVGKALASQRRNESLWRIEPLC